MLNYLTLWFKISATSLDTFRFSKSFGILTKGQSTKVVIQLLFEGKKLSENSITVEYIEYTNTEDWDPVEFMQEERGGEFHKQQFELKIENQLNVVGNGKGNPSFLEQSSRREYESFLDQQQFSGDEDDGQSNFRQSSNKELKNQNQGGDNHNSVLNNQNLLSNEHVSKEFDQQLATSNNNVPPLSLNFLHHNNSLQTDSARGNVGNQMGSSHGEETGVFGAKSSLQNTILSSQRIPHKENMIKNAGQDDKSRDSIFHEDILEKNQNSGRQQLSWRNSSKGNFGGSSKNLQENNNSNNNNKNNQDDAHYFPSAIYSRGGQQIGSHHNMSVNDLSQISQKSGGTKQLNSFAQENQVAVKNGNTKNLLEEVFKEDNNNNKSPSDLSQISNNRDPTSHNGTFINSLKHSKIEDKELESQKQQQSNLHNSSYDYQSINNNNQKEHFDSSIIHNINNADGNASENVSSNITHNNQTQDKPKQQQLLESEIIPSRGLHSYDVHQINEESNNEKESPSSQKPPMYISEIIGVRKETINHENNSINQGTQESPVLRRLLQDQDPSYEQQSSPQRFTLGQIPAEKKLNSPSRNSQFSSAIQEGQLFRSSETGYLFQSHQTDIHKRQTSEVSDIFETESTKLGYWKEKYEIVASKEKQYKKSIEDQRQALQVLKSDINKIEFLHRMEKFPMMRSQVGSEASEESKIQTWHVVIFGMIALALGYILKKLTL